MGSSLDSDSEAPSNATSRISPNNKSSAKKRRQREKRSQLAADVRAGKLVPISSAVKRTNVTSYADEDDLFVDEGTFYQGEEKAVVSSSRNVTRIKARRRSPVGGSNASRTESSLPDARTVAKSTNGFLLRLLGTAGGVLKGVLYILSFVWTVLEKPFLIILTLYVLLWVASKYVPTMQDLLSPVCDAPFASYVIPICRLTPTADRSNTWSTSTHKSYVDMAELQSRMSEVVELMQPDDIRLADGISQSTAVIRDLTNTVKLSLLPSKNMIVNELDRFVDDGTMASRGLSKLSARVAGAVDAMISIDEYVINRLETISSTQASTRNSLIARIFHSPSSIQLSARRDLIGNFERISTQTASALARLVDEAQVNLAVLDRLEERQQTLDMLIQREMKDMHEEDRSLHRPSLEQLITHLGLDRRAIEANKENKAILVRMGKQREKVRDRVKKAIDALVALEQELDELRSRVAQPAILGVADDESAEGLPFEAHLSVLRAGIDRLRFFRDEGRQREDRLLGNKLADRLPTERQIGS